MTQEQFVTRHQQRWQELSAILGQIEGGGVRRLSTDTVRQFGLLYRQTASDLAYARTYFAGSQTEHYLNGLVTRAHTHLYSEEPRRLSALWRFFTLDVPQTIRDSGRLIALAAAITLVGALVGFFGLLLDSNVAQALLPEAVRYHVVTLKGGQVISISQSALTGTAILFNNLRVGVMALGLGVTMGVGTGLVLFQNGLLLGGLAAHYFRAGLSWGFWALIVPHGVIEFTAIFLCAAAGFALGWPIVDPGDLTRKEALMRGARTAVKLTLGSIPFFTLAATIEGWATPSTMPEAAKYLVGALSALLGLSYCLIVGRRRPDRASEKGAETEPTTAPAL